MYRAVLFLHVLGAITALGPTLTYGMWIALAERQAPATRAFVLGAISWVDGHLATPSYVAQAVTGVTLILIGEIDFLGTPWLVVSVGIYAAIVIVAMAAYAPTFRRQTEAARRVAEAPDDEDAAVTYAALARRSFGFGVATTVLTLVIVGLMVIKPQLWG